MKILQLLIACFATLFLFVADAAAQQTDQKIADVLKAVSAYDTAWNKKDVAAVEKYLAPEYVYFSSTGDVSDRWDTIKFLATPDYKLTFVERSEIKAFRSGSTVIVSSRWKGKGKYSGGEINDDQRCGQVFVRSGGGWKILSEHCVQIAKN